MHNNMFNLQTIDRLMLGIKSIVSENRSSFSDEEIILLEECIAFLETAQSAENSRSPAVIVIVSSVIKILLRVLLGDDFHKMKNFF